MEKDPRKKPPEKVIEKKKWADFLSRLIDVLRINVFLIDSSGRLVIPPSDRFGRTFLASSFGFDFSGSSSEILKNFQPNDSCLVMKDSLDLHVFAIPVTAPIAGKETTLAYLMVGPVILDKRWNNNDYLNMASQVGLKAENLIDRIHEVRLVSLVSVKAIVDLLSAVARDIVELRMEKRRLAQKRFRQPHLSRELMEEASSLFTTIHLDELLVNILDVVLNLTKAECGSIMILDEENEDLVMKVSRGIDGESESARLKVGEGIAGLAAQERRSFMINGTDGNERIRHLLKRPEIKESIVLPLFSRDEIFGVLSLHTTSGEGQIKDNADSLRHLSRLISTAIHTL